MWLVTDRLESCDGVSVVEHEGCQRWCNPLLACALVGLWSTGWHASAGMGVVECVVLTVAQPIG